MNGARNLSPKAQRETKATSKSNYNKVIAKTNKIGDLT
jgi:hypothetical protein